MSRGFADADHPFFYVEASMGWDVLKCTCPESGVRFATAVSPPGLKRLSSELHVSDSLQFCFAWGLHFYRCRFVFVTQRTC